MRVQFKRKLNDGHEAGPLGLYRFYHARQGMTIQIDPLLSVYLLVGLLLFGYVTAVTVAYTIRSKRAYNQITFADIALPWRWGGINQKAGQTNLAYGKALFEEKEYLDSLHMLRAGLTRAPEDHEARLMLAKLYMSAGKSELATNVLDIGLDYGYPENQQYVDSLLLLLNMREDYASIGDIARKLRAFPQVQADQKRWDALGALELESLKRQRNFEQILAYSREMLAINPKDNQCEDLEVFSLIKLGFIPEAQSIMDSMSIARQHSPQFRFLEAMIALQTDNLEVMDDILATLMIWPTNPFTLQSQAIVELNEADLPERRDMLLSQFLQQYAENPAALELAIRLFGEFLSIEQTDRLINQLAAFNPGKARGLQLFAIQARLFEGQGMDAMRIYQEWIQKEEVAEQMVNYPWLEQLLVVLSEKRKDDRVTLWNMTREQQLPSSAYVTCARSLFVADDFETAERIAENGLLYYPQNTQLAQIRRESQSKR